MDQPREMEPHGDRLVPAKIDRDRAHRYIADNFPKALGFREEERLARLLAHVWNEGWKAARP